MKYQISTKRVSIVTVTLKSRSMSMELEKKSLSEQVYDKLRQRIIDLEIEPWQKDRPWFLGGGIWSE